MASKAPQIERYNDTYTVHFYDNFLIIIRRGIRMTVTGSYAEKLRSDIAHSAEPCADIDDFWHNH